MAELGYEQGKNLALEVVPAASPELRDSNAATTSCSRVTSISFWPPARKSL
jgi:hypothetical protein